MSDKWRLGTHRGKFAAVTGRGKSRRRIKLDETDEQSAQAAVRRLNVEADRLSLPAQMSLDQLYGLYEKDRAAHKVVNLTRIKEVGRTLKPIWGSLTADEIDKRQVQRFIEIRRNAGCSDGTIRNDLAYITAALNLAVEAKILSAAPKIAKPPAPRPRSRWLARQELTKLIENAIAPHIQLFIVLAITTAGRPKHILELTWDRVDLKHRIITLDNPQSDRTRKGRATVPINDTAMEHLTVAQRTAETPFVIELDGKPVKSVRNGVKAAARRANLSGVSQYVLRHTAGVYMAQAGVPIPEIGQFLGHSDLNTTYKTYARFHPEHLRQASKSLEITK